MRVGYPPPRAPFRVLVVVVVAVAVGVLGWGTPVAHAADEVVLGSHSDLARFFLFGSDRAGPAQEVYVHESPLDAWIALGNLGTAAGLDPIPTLNLPVALNILFIGFHQGEGAQAALKLEEDDLRPWFEHMEHMVRHSILPRGDTTTPTSDHEHTRINHMFKFQIVDVDPMVAHVVERTLNASMRPELEIRHVQGYSEPYTTGYAHVDVHVMTSLLSSLLEALHLDESYTLVILNPNITRIIPHDVKLQSYGYRMGLSDAEAMILRQGKNKQQFADFLAKDPFWIDKETEKAAADVVKFLRPAGIAVAGSETVKVEFRNRRKLSLEWAMRYQIPERVDGGTDEQLTSQARRILQADSVMEKLLLRWALEGRSTQEDCLVDTWISDNRFAFIDLTAGPFQWGPIVAGEGVRTTQTLPYVDRILHFQEAARQYFEDRPVMSRSTAKKQFNRNEIMADIQVLTDYEQRSCTGVVAERVDMCRDLRERITTLMKYLESWEDYEAGTLEEKGLAELRVLSHGSADHVTESNATHATANFLSHLGAVISTTIHHVVTPASRHLPSFFPERITFHLFVVTNHNSYKPLAVENFHYEIFKKELAKLEIGGQQFHFALHTISMADDVALAVAYSSSLRSAVVPTLKLSGEFVASKRLYLDTATLQHELQALRTPLGPTAEAGTTTHGRTLNVPIFLFSLDFPLPVFIDKYFQAKALSDMVVAVQSNFSSWESHMACNGKPITWNLRNPLRSVLAATITYMGGVPPTHISFSDPLQRTSQNWLWSVGDNPLSYTSSRWRMSTFHKDAVHRNYVIGTLNRVLALVNEGIDTLTALPTNKGNYKLREDLMLEEMRGIYADIKNTCKKISVAVQLNEFSRAAPLLNPLADKAEKFRDLSKSAATMLEPLRCLDYSTESSRRDWLFLLVVASLVVVLLIVALLRPKKVKPKMN